MSERLTTGQLPDPEVVVKNLSGQMLCTAVVMVTPQWWSALFQSLGIETATTKIHPKPTLPEFMPEFFYSIFYSCRLAFLNMAPNVGDCREVPGDASTRPEGRQARGPDAPQRRGQGQDRGQDRGQEAPRPQGPLPKKSALEGCGLSPWGALLLIRLNRNAIMLPKYLRPAFLSKAVASWNTWCVSFFGPAHS